MKFLFLVINVMISSNVLVAASYMPHSPKTLLESKTCEYVSKVRLTFKEDTRKSMCDSVAILNGLTQKQFDQAVSNAHDLLAKRLSKLSRCYHRMRVLKYRNNKQSSKERKQGVVNLKKIYQRSVEIVKQFREDYNNNILNLVI